MPPFNMQGDLPSGVHRATLAEAYKGFRDGAPQRIIVTEQLQLLIALVQGTGKLERVFSNRKVKIQNQGDHELHNPGTVKLWESPGRTGGLP